MTSHERYQIGSDELNYRVVPNYTVSKHNLLKIYLDIVSNSMRKKWHLVYVDLYSSNGKCLIEDTDTEIVGSPLIALKYPYKEYIFNDINEELINELETRIKREFPDKYPLCKFFNTDADNLFHVLLENKTIPDGHLLTIFSDPNGLSPDFNTINFISENYRADILFHFSYGIDMKRNIKRYIDEYDSKLDRFIGDKKWRDIPDINEREVTKYYYRKLRNLEYVGFSDNLDLYSVKNSKNRILYYFLLLSKEEIAYKFYREAMKYSSNQTDLFN